MHGSGIANLLGLCLYMFYYCNKAYSSNHPKSLEKTIYTVSTQYLLQMQRCIEMHNANVLQCIQIYNMAAAKKLSTYCTFFLVIKERVGLGMA